MDKQDVVSSDSVPLMADGLASKLVSMIVNAKKLEKAINHGTRLDSNDSPLSEPNHTTTASATDLSDSVQESELAKSEETAFNDPSIGEVAIHQLEQQQNIEKIKQEVEHLRQKAKSLETDTEIKKWIAQQTFGFMICWCCFVGLMIIIYFAVKAQNIEKEVIITLLGSTTISVVGLVGFIVKGLFGTKEEKQPKGDEKK
ncbi:hypothetical protein [Plesiomonas shigelloides]|uniref:hypothetical protein n=1 Tax=Plesiomonas shigelloides TaxID=703 RepID=UPI00126282E2|nr:hypothetical protein [Plesiomonas shigelloides]KAB7669205.1 hypothetical protein GBN25_02925 [Plesiomonas shigelloides]